MTQCTQQRAHSVYGPKLFIHACVHIAACKWNHWTAHHRVWPWLDWSQRSMLDTEQQCGTAEKYAVNKNQTAYSYPDFGIRRDPDFGIRSLASAVEISAGKTDFHKRIYLCLGSSRPDVVDWVPSTTCTCLRGTIVEEMTINTLNSLEKSLNTLSPVTVSIAARVCNGIICTSSQMKSPPSASEVSWMPSRNGLHRRVSYARLPVTTHGSVENGDADDHMT